MTDEGARLIKDADGLRPVPDPTVLTTQALDREISTVYAQMTNRLQSLEDLLGSRLDAMDMATDLRLQAIREIPEQITIQITHLRELQEERFKSISLQFQERDIRTEQASKAAKEALDAALLAAKELVTAQNVANAAAAAKSEDNFTKLLDQTATLIRNQGEAQDARLTEIKERIDRGAGGIEGAAAAHIDTRDFQTDHRAETLKLVSILGVVVAIIAVMASIAIPLVLR